jgi:hypothetical protein
VLIVRQSTARTVTVGPVLDADGVAVTGGVVGDFKISKNGGAPAALDGSATLTHRHTGHYSLALTATDLDTVGQAEVVIDDTVNACPMKEITVLEEAVYDALYAASATGMLPANVTQWGGSATPVTNFTTVFSTDFAANYDATNDVWKTNVTFYAGVTVTASDDPLLMLDTTVSSVTSQTVLVLTAGPPDTGAIPPGSPVQITDSATATQKCVGFVLTYVVSGGGTVFTLTLDADPGVFTIAAGDKVKVLTKTQSRTESAAGVWGALRASYASANTFGEGVASVRGLVTGPVQSVGNDAISSGSFSPGALVAAAVGTDFLGPTAVSAALCSKIADIVLRRLMTNVEGSSYGDTPGVGSLYGLVQQMQESNLVDNAGFLTVYKTDGTTELAQKAVTTDAAGEPVTGIS